MTLRKHPVGSRGKATAQTTLVGSPGQSSSLQEETGVRGRQSQTCDAKGLLTASPPTVLSQLHRASHSQFHHGNTGSQEDMLRDAHPKH